MTKNISCSKEHKEKSHKEKSQKSQKSLLKKSPSGTVSSGTASSLNKEEASLAKSHMDQMPSLQEYAEQEQEYAEQEYAEQEYLDQKSAIPKNHENEPHHENQHHGDKEPIVIRKYANRRLYSTQTSEYVTLGYLRDLVNNDIPFRVEDNKTGNDITRAVLTQIVLESDPTQQALMSERLLRRMIGVYGNTAYGQILSNYLEVALHYYDQHQSAIDKYVHKSIGTVFPINQMNTFLRSAQQNFWSSLASINPMLSLSSTPTREKPDATTTPSHNETDENSQVSNDSLDERIMKLQQQVAHLAKQLESQASPPSGLPKNKKCS